MKKTMLNYTPQTIRRAGKGCNNSFQIVLKKHYSTIDIICKRLTLRAEYDDLFQAASIGLLEACKRFSRKTVKGFQLYAKKYMLGEIYRTIAQSRIIYFPSTVWQYLPKIKRELGKGREDLESIIRRVMNRSDKVEDYIGYIMQALKIELIDLGDDIGYIVDNNVMDDDAYYIPKIATEILNERELDVIILTCGLYGGEPMSVPEAQEIIAYHDPYVYRTHRRAMTKLKKVIDREDYFERN